MVAESSEHRKDVFNAKESSSKESFMCAMITDTKREDQVR